jgi:mRNA interferase MazF
MRQVKANKGNGLSKTSAVDCFQVKNFSNERLVEKIGFIDGAFLKNIHSTIAKTLNPNYTLG